MAKLSKEAREFFRQAGARGAKKTNGDATPDQRKERARNAAKARWAKRKDKP
jgi:hypothetical protein